MAPGEDPGAGTPLEELAPPESGAPGGRPLARGIEAIADALRSLPAGPGVYRMLDRRGDALYVGKARSLKKRVATYTQLAKLPRRLQRMVAETASLEVVTTHTEVEALLLESNLIKRLMPRYNVLLRDDKSFPYILITGDHDYPQIAKHRGAHSRDGEYFGPFASAGAVNRTITALEKAFLLRSCSDSVFSARTRPCLMHQIKRCSAPCVARIGQQDYAALVRQAKDFLTGRSHDIQGQLSAAMEEASERLDFEAAAVSRDRLRALAHIQSHQAINLEGLDDADVIAAHQEASRTCVQVFFFRAGRNYGNRAYFPSHDKNLGVSEVLSAFVAQFYDNKPTPKVVLVSHALEDQALLAEALALRAGHKVELAVPQRGAKRKLIDNALANAREALARRLAESSSQRQLLETVASTFGLEGLPQRIEVYDNSHIQGSEPYGAMIAAGPEGFIKTAYRKFRIRGEGKAGSRGSNATSTASVMPAGLAEEAPDYVAGDIIAGDDYAMMREVLERRFARALKEDPERDRGLWPDLVLIDGGRGQLNVALAVFEDLGLGDLPVAAIAKGPDRDAGRERIFLPGRAPLLLPPRDPLLYYLQRLRDEAHRFAIGSHRGGRSRARLRSTLDDIPGIGAKRKRTLLHHFGSAGAVARAGLSDLEAVEGISRTVAQRIYDHFHGDA
ncbi:MAG: excinuclease ABC subunit UvrC [Kiloniellales bacterium]